MIFPFKFAVGLALLALPFVEIALLIKAVGAFGFWQVLFWIIATAVLGAAIIRRSGLATFSKVFANIEAGGSGFGPMLAQGLVVLGGVLLILPGLLGDAIGALLLIPPVRWVVVRAFAGLITVQTRSGTFRSQTRDTWRSPHDETPDRTARGTDDTATRRRRRPKSSGSHNPEPPIIEGEYQRLDDDAKD